VFLVNVLEMDRDKSPLRLARLAKGLSMPSLGKLANTSAQQIDRLERGQRKMTRQWADRLAPYLDVPSEVLVYPDKSETGDIMVDDQPEPELDPDSRPWIAFEAAVTAAIEDLFQAESPRIAGSIVAVILQQLDEPLPALAGVSEDNVLRAIVRKSVSSLLRKERLERERKDRPPDQSSREERAPMLQYQLPEGRKK
jgi:transcriptional regulator with XRE-family HTH domain